MAPVLIFHFHESFIKMYGQLKTLTLMYDCFIVVGGEVCSFRSSRHEDGGEVFEGEK